MNKTSIDFRKGRISAKYTLKFYPELNVLLTAVHIVSVGKCLYKFMSEQLLFCDSIH